MQLKQILHYGRLRLMQQKQVQRILLPFGRDLRPERWIFILGCYNSATTLLASILGKHPLMDGLPNEGAFLTDVLPFPESYGWPRMWSECVEQMLVKTGLEAEHNAQRIKRQWSIWYPREGSNLIEKSISNITRTRFLEEYFSPAYFIYIVRNGYVVSKGIQKKANYQRWNCSYKETGYPIELCARQWQESDRIIERDGPGLKNLLTLTYEDLTEDTAGTLKKITDFLGVAPMPGEIMQQEWSIHEVNSSIVNMNPTGLKRLSEGDFDKIESVAGDVLKKYGYNREG